MSRKRKGPTQSGQPKKRVLAPIVPESVPYENPAYITQESQKSEIDLMVKGQPQNPIETSMAARGGHSKGTSKPPLEPGKPKRSVGRPSKLSTIEQRLDDATEEFLLEVISGAQIQQSGATGKSFKAVASLAVRTKAAELWISRRRPQLSQQAVAAQIQTDVRVEDVTNRQLAQSVMRVLGRADVSEVEQLAQKKLVAPTGSAKGEGADISGVSHPPCKSKIEEPLEPQTPAHGHKVAARNSSGAYLRWHGTGGHGGKWAAYDSANVCVGMTPRWEKAVAILMNTKPSTETIHPDPFELDERTDEFAQRRMERAARQPRVITRRGR